MAEIVAKPRSPEAFKALSTQDADNLIPGLSRDLEAIKELRRKLLQISTTHRLVLGDSRKLRSLEDGSVHLVVTSPPYWTLKSYSDREGQLGGITEYAEFLQELDKVWTECFRVLIPGGRLVVVVGDVCLSRRKHGRHQVVPLHADTQIRCRAIGFDNLAPIFWYKIANANYEAAGNGAGFFGKPYEPNAVVKNDVEFILMERKPGGYRKPDPKTRLNSVISNEEYRLWFRQVWEDLPGESTRVHPAPFPEPIAERLVRMFSFAGDTVLDPFNGTGTTMIAAARCGRNSIGIEIDPDYISIAEARFKKTFIPPSENRRLSKERW